MGNIMRCIRRIGKYLLLKPFTLLADLVLLWRNNVGESFMFVLYHRETFSIGLLNILKKQSVCGNYKKGRKHKTPVLMEEAVQHERQQQKV
jgi:hypothetical protein